MQTLVPAESTFGCVACGAKQAVLCCGLELTSECVDSETSWEGLPCRPRSVTACVLQCYKVICSWSLPVLNLDVHM